MCCSIHIFAGLSAHTLGATRNCCSVRCSQNEYKECNLAQVFIAGFTRERYEKKKPIHIRTMLTQCYMKMTQIVTQLYNNSSCGKYT